MSQLERPLVWQRDAHGVYRPKGVTGVQVEKGSAPKGYWGHWKARVYGVTYQTDAFADAKEWAEVTLTGRLNRV